MMGMKGKARRLKEKGDEDGREKEKRKVNYKIQYVNKEKNRIGGFGKGKHDDERAAAGRQGEGALAVCSR